MHRKTRRLIDICPVRSNRGRRTASAQASASHGIIPSTSSSGLGVDPVADLRGIDRYMPRKLALDLQHIYIDYVSSG